MKRNLHEFSAWALAFGCSIGWGAFIMPGTTFLPKSGILGTILGIVIGMLIMMIIAWNYHVMIGEHPVSGGAFSFTTHVLGYDHGFLCAWFLCLTYIALIWANASAMTLLFRYTLGNHLQFGFHYNIVGYDVYFGESLLCMLAMIIAALACIHRKKLGYILQTVFAVTLLAGIVICFFGAFSKHTGGTQSLKPWFTGDTPPLTQIMRVVAIIPWAFVGFESISHSAEEFSFSPKKSWRIMAFAIFASALAYILLLFTSVLVLPDSYATWPDYIADLAHLEGTAAMPTFSAMRLALGNLGIALLGCTMFSALFTSIVGNMIAASRMIYALSQDRVISEKWSRLNGDGAPRNAILFVLLLSIFVPLLGRTAIGWHVDVSNVGATVAYGYTSFAAYRCAKRKHQRKTRILGMIGLVVSVLFLLMLLIPNALSGNALETESYLILSLWVVLGFALYRQIFKKDTMNRFGRTTVVWVALLILGLFTALSWQRQASISATGHVLTEIEMEHNDVVHQLVDDGQGSDELMDHSVSYNAFLESKMKGLQNTHLLNSSLVLGIVLLTVGILISNYSILFKKNQEQERTIGVVQKRAITDALTGVKNKSAYNEKEQLMNQSITTGQQGPFAIAICDINNLKIVNDTQGHKAGDAFIQEGCQIICNTYKHSPVYRIGGDEFAAILEGADYEARFELDAQLQAIIHRHLREGGITLATGMSDFDPDADHYVNDVFERADEKMYENKKQMKAKAFT